MVSSFLNKIFNYEKWDRNDEEEQENLTRSCSDGEDDSEEVSVDIETSKVSHTKFITKYEISGGTCLQLTKKKFANPQYNELKIGHHSWVKIRIN